MEKYLLQEADPTFAEVLHLIKLIFGARINMGYVKLSLKEQLNDVVGYRLEATIFLTDIGSR